MRIDFVSDVACPWCAIGFSALERALERIGGDLGEVELYMQPFELNPTMGPDGEDATEYLTSKYGMSREQFAANRARIVERGAAEGFAFGPRTHIWNTFAYLAVSSCAIAKWPPPFKPRSGRYT